VSRAVRSSASRSFAFADVGPCCRPGRFTAAYTIPNWGKLPVVHAACFVLCSQPVLAGAAGNWRIVGASDSIDPTTISLHTGRVYSVGHAARGQRLYKAQCADCHGSAMQGASGTPLTGDNFLSNWSARPLANLIDKIQKTMPFNLPGKAIRSLWKRRTSTTRWASVPMAVVIRKAKT
jgi:cytochrome c5